jgi:hypothetical protein
MSEKIWTLNEANFMEAYEAEVTMIGMQKVTLDFDIIGLLSLIGSLQLGLKHPGNNGPTAEFCKTFVRTVQTQFFGKFPAISAAINKGFETGEIKTKPELTVNELRIALKNSKPEIHLFTNEFLHLWAERLIKELAGYQLPANDSSISPDPEEISHTAGE